MGECGRRCPLLPPPTFAWWGGAGWWREGEEGNLTPSSFPRRFLSVFPLCSASLGGAPASHSFDCPAWWMCSVRNGPSRGPPRRFWVKQHLISNPSIPSQAGSLFTGVGKHRNPFLVRVSQKKTATKNLDTAAAVGTAARGRVRRWWIWTVLGRWQGDTMAPSLLEGGRGWFSQRGPSVWDSAPLVGEVGLYVMLHHNLSRAIWVDSRFW